MGGGSTTTRSGSAPGGQPERQRQVEAQVRQVAPDDTGLVPQGRPAAHPHPGVVRTGPDPGGGDVVSTVTRAPRSASASASDRSRRAAAAASGANSRDARTTRGPSGAGTLTPRRR